ncbi:MAG: hypothetical protein PF904_07000 [Kiritimatiellae bacterium]|jgi:YHS domain-containing protein|nr:hypothetical protein [Kiritimatiellia bacterium]
MNNNKVKVMAVVSLVSLSLFAVEAKNKPAQTVVAQKTCPVMGGKIDKSLYVDADGKRVYVCCAGCIAKVKADPDKYIKVLADKGEGVATLQTKCPVMGGAIDKNQFADVKGKRIYVCCGGCIAKIKADPDKYIGVLEKQGVILYDVPVEKPVE